MEKEMISRPPGIEDIFPDRIARWNRILSAAREAMRLYNYREIIIPVMEFTEVFSRGIGDETDIVSKEMFTFEDRGGRSLTLRPEGTASVVRAYVENGEYNRLASCKLFYAGPMFRAERPQKGRLRQFNQFGAEFFGSEDPYYDYEIIALMDTVAKRLGIAGYSLLVNSIGCPKCRGGYLAELVRYYGGMEEKLCDDCRRRLRKNPLRLLDCKNPGCVELRKGSPLITGTLCEECRDHFAAVRGHLERSGIAHTVDPYLVRGLDYYTRTTFEFVSGRSEGQNAFAAGGRYDNLVEVFGGKPTPAVGFAAGIERIALMLGDVPDPAAPLDAFIMHSGGATLGEALRAASELRGHGISVDLDPSTRGFKSQMKKADRERALFAVIVGEEELAGGYFTVRDMASGGQVRVERDALAGHFFNLTSR
jgi:histidyl-tRNA synthetase